MDDAGHPLTGAFDAEAIRKITSAASIPLASMRADDDDIDWIQRRAQVYLEAVQEDKVVPRWKETGYWLIVPILLVALYCFRRGWTVKWLPVVLIATASISMSNDVQDAWLDLFATHDQRGRFSLEHDDYKQAAARFDDPMWRGAQYLAGDYAGVLESFADIDSAEAYFYIGNTLAHMKDYSGALKAYDNTLARRADFADARANYALVQTLVKKEKDDSGEPTTVKPDQVDIQKRRRETRTQACAHESDAAIRGHVDAQSEHLASGVSLPRSYGY